MPEEFVPEDNSFVSPALPDDRPNPDSALSEQEVVRISVVGSRKIVLETIHTLYRLGFAPVGDWSKLQPGPQPGQVVSRPLAKMHQIPPQPSPKSRFGSLIFQASPQSLGGPVGGEFLTFARGLVS